MPMLESVTVADLEHRNCRLWLPKTRSVRDDGDDGRHEESRVGLQLGSG